MGVTATLHPSTVSLSVHSGPIQLDPLRVQDLFAAHGVSLPIHKCSWINVTSHYIEGGGYDYDGAGFETVVKPFSFTLRPGRFEVKWL